MKTMRCGCGMELSIHKKQCIATCSRCQRQNLFLCHSIPIGDDLLRINCRTCKETYSAFTCPNCKGFFAVTNFQPGRVYGCPCGFRANIMVCNKCNASIALPSKWDYEAIALKCMNCTLSFKYFICKQCQKFNYMHIESMEQKCQNKGCMMIESQVKLHQKWVSENNLIKSGNLVSRNTIINGLFLEAHESEKVIQSRCNPYEIKKGESKKQLYLQKEGNQLRQRDLCKVCLENPADMLNDQCYHLAVCQKCSTEVKRKCPICRQIGNYKFVFKS